VRRMITAGVDTSARTKSGYTGLHAAMRSNSLDTVGVLLAHSAIQLDSTNNNGYTALHTACVHASVEGVRMFLAHPACTREVVNMVDKYGETAEMAAINSSNPDCARLVREYLEKQAGDDTSIDSEVQVRTEKAKSIESEKNSNNLVMLMKNQQRSGDDLNKVSGTSISTPSEDPRKELLNFLIEQKEKDLACPVCLVTVMVPVYSCLESHLICSACRHRVAKCPECRVVYKDKQPTRRHRYAERMLEELTMLRGELSKSFKSL